MSNGKGDWPRPCSTTKEEQELRKAYMFGEITFKTYNRRYNKLRKQGLIKRDGRILK